MIESKKNKKLEDDIIHLFNDLIPGLTYERENNQAILFYACEIDVSLHDVILNMMSDTLTDLRLYESHVFASDEERKEHINDLKKLLENIPFAKHYYLDDRTVIKHYLSKLDEELKRFFLRKFYQDPLMMETLHVYLESNLNMVIASKKLYVHRNTLIQRIDKFYHMTGLDPRIFSDALLIYHLIF